MALDDIPRQISKDSGHGSMSPTSVNQPTTPDKTVQEKELMSNAEFIPHGYAKATAINTRCFHGNDHGNDQVTGPKIKIGLHASVRACEHFVDFEVIVN